MERGGRRYERRRHRGSKPSVFRMCRGSGTAKSGARRQGGTGGAGEKREPRRQEGERFGFMSRHNNPHSGALPCRVEGGIGGRLAKRRRGDARGGHIVYKPNLGYIQLR